MTRLTPLVPLPVLIVYVLTPQRSPAHLIAAPSTFRAHSEAPARARASQPFNASRILRLAPRGRVNVSAVPDNLERTSRPRAQRVELATEPNCECI